MPHYYQRLHADLIAVAKDLSHWAIVEVELHSHSLHSHIWPQMIKLHEICSIMEVNCREKILREIGLEDYQVQQMRFDQPKLFLIFDKFVSGLVGFIPYFSRLGSTFYLNASISDYNEFVYNEEILLDFDLKRRCCSITGDKAFVILSNPSIIGINLNQNSLNFVYNQSGEEVLVLEVRHGRVKANVDYYSKDSKIELLNNKLILL